jgi:hypothetical protein
MKCLICFSDFKKANKLSFHLNEHNISKKEYYDNYLKEKNEGICYCGNLCNFKSISLGYHDYCSTKCLANDKKIILNRTEKVRGENHWMKRTGNHPTRGKTYEEMHGEKKALKLKKELSENGKKLIGNKNHFYGKSHTYENKELFRKNRLGRTYEEIYGLEKGLKLRKNKIKSDLVKTGWRNYWSQYPLNFYDTKMRFKILKSQTYKCPVCFKNISRKASKNLHHINYVKKDNRRRNLIYLCVGCHVTTNGNRSF